MTAPADASGMAELQPTRPRILLFIPMYNCAPQIPRVIAQMTPDVRALLDEVILVNNRSTDGGQAAAAEALRKIPELNAKILLNDHNYGLGGSHKVAFNYALANGFDYLIVLHGDDQGSIADMAPLLRQGSHLELDCLLGARFMRGSKLGGYSAFRTFGNHVFNWIYSIASGRRIYDLGAGLNLYRMAAFADRAYLKCADDLTFNYHMILRSITARQRIRFFPLEWREDDQVSNVKLVRQTMRVAQIVLAYALGRRAYLDRDYAAHAATGYTASVVHDSRVSEAAAS